MSNLDDRKHAVASKLGWMAGGAMGDVVEELRKEGHVSDAHYVAVCRFLDDLRRWHGTSDGLVTVLCTELGVRVRTSTHERLAPPGGGGDTDACERVMRVLDGLFGHERKLFSFLVVQKELARGSLSDFGRQMSGYETNKTTRAYAVGRINSLLASIAELYG